MQRVGSNALRSAGLLLIVAVAICYANSFRGVFVFDDIPSIVNNPTIRQFWPVGPLLHPPAASATVAGRPLLNLSLAVSYALSGLQPWGYHLVNGLIHAGAALALFGIIRRTTHRLGLAFSASLLWAVHPLQTESVTYVIQRAESLASLCYLLSVYCFVRMASPTSSERIGSGTLQAFRALTANKARKPWRLPLPIPRMRWDWLSVVFCFLGIATKEIVATAPVVILLYDRTFAAGSFRAAFSSRSRRIYYAALFATWIPLALLVLSTGGNRGGSAGFNTHVTWWAYAATQFPALAQYLKLTVLPFPLAFEYGTFWVSSFSGIAGPVVLVLGLIAGTLWALARHPRVGFLGAAFFLLLAPTSLTPGTTQMIVEHRMYLALAPLLIAIVFSLATALPRASRALSWTALCVVAVALAAVTVGRNADYSSQLRLWFDTVQRRPQSALARYSLGTVYLNNAQLPEAVEQLTEGRRLKPDYPELLVNLGAALRHAGRLPEAIEADEQAVKLVPGQPQAENNLAIALAESGRAREAIPHFQAALRAGADDAEIHANLGFALEDAGRGKEAIAEYRRSVELDPGDEEIKGRLRHLESLARVGLL